MRLRIVTNAVDATLTVLRGEEVVGVVDMMTAAAWLEYNSGKRELVEAMTVVATASLGLRQLLQRLGFIVEYVAATHA